MRRLPPPSQGLFSRDVAVAHSTFCAQTQSSWKMIKQFLPSSPFQKTFTKKESEYFEIRRAARPRPLCSITRGNTVVPNEKVLLESVPGNERSMYACERKQK